MCPADVRDFAQVMTGTDAKTNRPICLKVTSDYARHAAESRARRRLSASYVAEFFDSLEDTLGNYTTVLEYAARTCEPTRVHTISNQTTHLSRRMASMCAHTIPISPILTLGACLCAPCYGILVRYGSYSLRQLLRDEELCDASRRQLAERLVDITRHLHAVRARKSTWHSCTLRTQALQQPWNKSCAHIHVSLLCLSVSRRPRRPTR